MPRLGFAPETDYKGLVYGAQFFKPINWGPISEAGASSAPSSTIGSMEAHTEIESMHRRDLR